MSRERPILFNGAMVRAILSGTKTQTRRAIKGIPWRPGCNPGFSQARAFSNAGEFRIAGSQEMTTGFRCPFGQPGDRLWVRETWCHAWDDERDQWSAPERYHYRADGIEVVHVDDGERSPWCPSIHMPRRACRLLLEITDVRVERLQAISEADARAEGVDPEMPDECVLAFERLWVSIGGPSSWNNNPWVWVIEFKVVTP
ncbi:TPA: hypothetical protein UOA92_000827 [Stenotrophomonas maltophilia]|nr:hypothetical protein [Stenotrophomonas maltophilia]